jgi:hypothetical protein
VYEYAEGERAPVEAMVSAAEGLLGSWERSRGRRSCFQGVEADDFRLWSNLELYVNPGLYGWMNVMRMSERRRMGC